MADEVDYVVVGAGSAGCALAYRLAEDGRHSVRLLEAGGPDRNVWIHIPVGYYRTIFDQRLGWGYETEPEPNLGGRRVPWPRGKVLGGSSSINGLVYVSGNVTVSGSPAITNLVAGGDVTLGGTLTLGYSADYQRTPPPGFATIVMRAQAGSRQQVVQ